MSLFAFKSFGGWEHILIKINKTWVKLLMNPNPTQIHMHIISKYTN